MTFLNTVGSRRVAEENQPMTDDDLLTHMAILTTFSKTTTMIDDDV